MPNYQQGKIYTIRCRTDDTMIYVGSTIQSLAKRWGAHKTKSRCEGMINRMLYNAINDNWNEWYIELYELYPCNSKEELLQKEGEIIREIGTLNIVINGRTNKQWHIDNKEYIKDKKKKYREDPEHRKDILQKKKDYYEKIKNTEAYITQAKEYRVEKRDNIIINVNKWREKNPEKVKEYREKNKEYMKAYCKEYYRKKKEEKQHIMLIDQQTLL